MFTLNNYTSLEHTAIRELECRYLVVGEEVGESGTPHLQGYIYFDNPRSFSSIKKKIPRAHIEVSVGTPQQASQYCKKDGKFSEKGNLPEQGQRNDISQIREQVNAGHGMRQIIETATSYQGIRTAELLLKYKEKKRDWQPEVVYIWGRSGTGKTRWAYDNFPFEDIHKQQAHQPKWWGGYDAHPVVILDEVDSQTSYAWLKELTDRYPHSVETKGGMRSFLAKNVIITSLTEPHRLFEDYPENGYEMLRRINKIISLD